MTALTDPGLTAIPGLRHGFFTRRGGVSDGVYASLNCGIGSDDDAGSVTENRRRVAAALTGEANALATPYQVHGAEVAVVDDTWPWRERPKADAIVTTRRGIAVAVGTADCGPVLLCDPRAGVIGAAHAGWRGARGGVLEAAVAAMEGLGADRQAMTAVLGPTISQANYEVGEDMRAAFDNDDARWFVPADRPGHARFDLPGYIVARLETAGVGQVGRLPHCTYADADSFYSYRRATHRGEADYGRMLAGIALVEGDG